MAWNGSDDARKNGASGKNESRIGSSSKSSPSLIRGLIGGGVVVLIGGIVAVLVLCSDKRQESVTDTTRKMQRIKEVAPAIVSPKPAAPVADVDSNGKLQMPTKVGETRNGYKLLPNGRLHKVSGVITSHVTRVGLAMKTFDHPANQSIASLLTVRPGDSMLGDSSLYYKDFDKHFKDSLNDEIVINDDDSDEVRGLKQAVIETKKELKVRMDRGEDLAKVMRDAREQLRELGLYRDELTAQVKSIAGDLNAELTEKDIHDLVDAANKMLDERGSEPLLLTGPMLYQLREQKIENENTNTEINQ